MAAHDDKISDNRRRLFKALSAAPVVMTLRPGTAAASSAYQCLAKIRDTGIEPTLTHPGGVSVTDHFAYQELPYWPLSDATPVDGVSSCDISSSYPDLAFIVEINGTYYDNLTPGSQTSVFSRLDLTNVTLGELGIKNSAGETCLTIESQTGRFAIVGEATGGDTGFAWSEVDGYYPAKNPDTAPYQGITGTCWDSFADPTALTILTKG